MTREATVLIVPGLRAHVPQHWQTLLASRLPRVRTVEPMGREDLDCARRVAAIEREANAIKGPLLLVAHSGGVLMVVHWARQTQRVVHGALLATPPDFERAMPAEYPTIEEVRAGGWLPVPRDRLPFSSIVAASRNDPLGRFATGAANSLISVESDISIRHLATVTGWAPILSLPN
jgi:predicted alpha/beta hydrolase family esterase